jgi:hypothetical protein
MAAVLEYQWDYIAPGATVSNFIHGYTQTDIGVYDAIPYNIGNIGTAYSPLFDIKLTQGEVSIHVDGTYARTTYIQNLASFNAVGAGLFFIFA